MSIAGETQETPPIARPRAIRWALTRAAFWIVISLVVMVLVLPRQQSTISSVPAHVAPSGGPSGGLLYHATNSMTYADESDGVFYIDALADEHRIHLVLDPKASATVLSPDDAATIGIDTDKLEFTGRLRIGSSEIAVAPVTIRFLSLRQMTLFNVQAFVSRDSQPTSVFGMDFLKRFDSYELEDGKLTLHW